MVCKIEITFYDIEAICALKYQNLDDKHFNMVSAWLATPQAASCMLTSALVTNAIIRSMINAK